MSKKRKKHIYCSTVFRQNWTISCDTALAKDEPEPLVVYVYLTTNDNFKSNDVDFISKVIFLIIFIQQNMNTKRAFHVSTLQSASRAVAAVISLFIGHIVYENLYCLKELSLV